jgi:tetratricopeptide (TPR) repeat protein
MKNKSVILGAILLVTGMTAFGQKGEISTAKSSYEQFEGLRGGNTQLALAALEKGKTAVDKAVANEKTSNDPEAWTLKALIYSGLAEKDSTDAGAKNVEEAIAALKKASELDTKGEQKANIDRANDNIYRVFISKAVKEYHAAKYKDSYATFNQAATFAGAGRDTTAIYYAAISAQNAAANETSDEAKRKSYQSAIEKYTALLPTSFSFLQDVYSNLSILYAATGDTTTAIKIAGEGSKRFPENSQLATREIEFSLMTHKEKETISKIQDQFAKEPKNKVLPYYLGIAYNAMKDFKNSEEWYKKAIEVDPDYAEATINLSGLIMNNGIDLYRQASSIPANKQAEYDAAMKKAQAEFDRALPYLTKATELSPKSALAWKNLKAYYDIKNDKAKSDEVKKKLDEL